MAIRDPGAFCFPVAPTGGQNRKHMSAEEEKTTFSSVGAVLPLSSELTRFSTESTASKPGLSNAVVPKSHLLRDNYDSCI